MITRLVLCPPQSSQDRFAASPRWGQTHNSFGLLRTGYAARCAEKQVLAALFLETKLDGVIRGAEIFFPKFGLISRSLFLSARGIFNG